MTEARDKSGKLLLAPDLGIESGEICHVVAVKAAGASHQQWRCIAVTNAEPVEIVHKFRSPVKVEEAVKLQPVGGNRNAGRIVSGRTFHRPSILGSASQGMRAAGQWVNSKRQCPYSGWFMQARSQVIFHIPRDQKTLPHMLVAVFAQPASQSPDRHAANPSYILILKLFVGQVAEITGPGARVFRKNSHHPPQTLHKAGSFCVHALTFHDIF